MVYWDLTGEKIEMKHFWKWQERGEIYVYALSGVSKNEIEKTIEIINDIINEFDLPMSVYNGNSHKEYDFAQQLIHQCSEESDKYLINFDCLSDMIYRLRNENKILPWAIVIVVDETEYRFAWEKAVYGIANADGICVIRNKYIDKAMKHEFGHMLGLDDHDKCAMDYFCNYEQFCEKCLNEIGKMRKI